MKFWQAERGQPPDPGLGMSADGEKDEFPVAFHDGQVRESGILGMQERRNASQKFDVVRPFDDHQDTRRLGIFVNSLR